MHLKMWTIHASSVCLGQFSQFSQHGELCFIWNFHHTYVCQYICWISVFENKLIVRENKIKKKTIREKKKENTMHKIINLKKKWKWMGDDGIRTHRKKSMSFSKSSLAAHKAISAIYLKVSRIYLYRFMRLNIDRITVYQSLFINKANVNRGSRNGMTCTKC